MVNTSKKLKKIPDGNKITSLISAIEDYLVSSDLKPGMEILPERQLAEKLGVSRFSLREALRVAQSQGLIEIVRGRRPRVAKPTPAAASKAIGLILKRSEKTFMDLIEARQGLECQIAKLAAVRANNSQIKKLKQTVKQMEQNKDDINICIENDFEFHEILVEASHNIVFEIMLEPLSELLKAVRMETMQRKGVQRAINGHKEILKAVIEKKSDKANEAMSKHLWMAKEDLRRIEQDGKAT